MREYSNHSLKSYNTFGIDAVAERLVIFEDSGEVVAYVNEYDLTAREFLILGEGSNILFTRDPEGEILKISGRGIDIVNEDDRKALVRADAGENWDGLVKFCVDHGFGGLENLSLIPGNVGSSPIQNIGAYGVELKEVFYELEAVDILTGGVVKFTPEQCKFGYRNSIFKKSKSRKYIIISVSFMLDKDPELRLSYKGVKEELDKMGIGSPGIADVRQAIINIRTDKLPDPAKTGNAGSFFKNPSLPKKRYERLLNVFPEMPGFEQEDQTIKVPAAWLIDQCGWKGMSLGQAGVHAKQPLVLVNLGNATGTEILELSKRITKSVVEKFGIDLEPEVTII
jgi:UDP-N-acetylmuramate dehydrogenase